MCDRVLAGREPDRDVRLGLDRQHGLDELRRASCEPMHVDRRLGPGAHVEVLARCGIHRAGALLRDRLSPGLKLAPAGELLLGRRRDPGSQRLRQATVAGEHAGQRLQQRVQRIQRDAAVHPGVEVALAGANRDVEVAETAHREVELRRAASLHPAVEDDPRVGAALVGGEPVDDRVTTDLLLAVAGEAQVDRKLTRLGEQLRRLEEHPELALVVRHAPSRRAIRRAPSGSNGGVSQSSSGAGG